MKIWIGLASKSEALKQYFGEQKRAVVPPDVLKRGIFRNFDIEVTTNAYANGELSEANALEDFILEGALGHKVCVLLIDRDWVNFADNVNGYTFTVPFDPNEVTHNFQNFFHKILSSALKNLSHVGGWIESGGKAQELICLPLRNFHAGELERIPFSPDHSRRS